MKLARLVDPRLHSALDKLAAGELPLKLAFKLKGIVKKVNEEYGKYEEVRQAALSKYGKKDEAGNLIMDDKGNVQFDQGNMIEFAKELSILTNEEIDIPTIKLSELGDKVVVTFEDIEMLDGLVVED